MATMVDSARIASMAKRRKTKTKSNKSNEHDAELLMTSTGVVVAFAASNEIEMELSPSTKAFVDKVHLAYVMHLKVFVCGIGEKAMRVKQR